MDIAKINYALNMLQSVWTQHKDDLTGLIGLTITWKGERRKGSVTLEKLARYLQMSFKKYIGSPQSVILKMWENKHVNNW